MKKLIAVAMIALMCVMLSGCLYSEQDLDRAYNDGYYEGYDAGREQVEDDLGGIGDELQYARRAIYTGAEYVYSEDFLYDNREMMADYLFDIFVEIEYYVSEAQSLLRNAGG